MSFKNTEDILPYKGYTPKKCALKDIKKEEKLVSMLKNRQTAYLNEQLGIQTT